MERRHFLKTGATIMGALPFLNFHSFNFPDIYFPNNEVFNFTIGKCRVSILRDLIMPYTSDSFFLNVDPAELDKALKRYNIEPTNMPSPFLIPFLQYDDKKVLIDTGIGYADKPVMVGNNPFEKKGQLLNLLKKEGVNPEDITDVIITHFHPDHIGGNFNEKKELNFPNAKFHAPQEEWDFWHSSASADQSPFFKFFITDQVTPLKDKDLQLFSGDLKEVLPGITAIQAHGHTPGHIALHINFDNEHLLHVSDAFLHPLHIENLNWQTRYDMDHEEARRSREKLLGFASRENMPLHVFHFDFPGLGSVEKKGNSWKWNKGIYKSGK